LFWTNYSVGKVIGEGRNDELERTDKSNREKQTLLYKYLSRKSEDNVRKAIQAFRLGQDVSANILEGMLIQALEDVNSKLVQ
jgi:hypothetical protein